MMNVNFSNFIVVTDGKINDYYERSKGIYKWTENGQIMYPVEVAIPIIESRSRKCVGLGIISDIHINARNTTIMFTAEEIDVSTAKAYYNLYMQIKSMDASNSTYESDAYIPGAMGLAPAGKKPKKRDDDDDDFDNLSLSERMRKRGYL